MATGIADIANIKDQIKTVLDTNNTTTSSLRDLSANMADRVQQVAKINPEKLPLQSSVFPAVTIHTERKLIELSDIAADQVNGRRRCEITLKVLGLVFNTDYQTDVFNDPADEDLENLMENIEAILRSYSDLNSSVKWQFPTVVAYHSTTIGEQAHMRVGELDLQATLYY